MILTLTPIRPAGTLAERRLTLDRQGDALTVCGLRFDLAPLPEGAELPAQALAGPDFAGPVTRRGGVLRLGLHRWLGPEAPPEARLPATIALHDGQNGPVPLPGDEATHPADAPGATPGAIDWAQMITPEARAAESRSTAARALRQRRDRALAAGATLLQDVREEDWGQTTAYVGDPNGYLVEICSPVQLPSAG